MTDEDYFFARMRELQAYILWPSMWAIIGLHYYMVQTGVIHECQYC